MTITNYRKTALPFPEHMGTDTKCRVSRHWCVCPHVLRTIIEQLMDHNKTAHLGFILCAPLKIRTVSILYEIYLLQFARTGRNLYP